MNNTNAPLKDGMPKPSTDSSSFVFVGGSNSSSEESPVIVNQKNESTSFQDSSSNNDRPDCEKLSNAVSEPSNIESINFRESTAHRRGEGFRNETVPNREVESGRPDLPMISFHERPQERELPRYYDVDDETITVSSSIATRSKRKRRKKRRKESRTPMQSFYFFSRSIASTVLFSIQRIRIKGVPVLSGGEQVLNGFSPASKSVLLCGVKPPRYFFYMCSGSFCDIIQFGLDIFIHKTLRIQNSSVCWAVGFALSIVARHTSHRYLVFGDYVGGYRSSLLRMYGGYSIIIILSTLFNIIMARFTGLGHYVIWISTMLWTGVANYFILKRLWSFDGNGGSSQKETADGDSDSFVKNV